MTASIQMHAADRAEKLSFGWGDLTWFASGALGNSSELTLGQCVLKVGEGNPRHRHPNCGEILVVLQGEIEHTGPEDRMVRMREGDTISIPADTWHRAVNCGDREAVLLIAFDSAHRETIGEDE